MRFAGRNKNALTTVCNLIFFYCGTAILSKLDYIIINTAVVIVAIGPKRKAVTGDRGELHNEELHCLYCSLSIIRVFKSRRMRWVGHGSYGSCGGEGKCTYDFGSET
jgi:hypothetical protein